MKACSHSNLHDTERLEAGGARSERALGACTGAKRGCTCQRRCDSWTLDRREDCGKGRVACGKGRIAGRCFRKCEPHFVARTCAGSNLQWNNDNSTCERLLCDARWADVTGASGRRPQECHRVLALHTACDSSSHRDALTAAGHMRPGTPAGIRKRSTAFKPSPWLNPAPSRTPGYHHASSPNC